MSLSTQQGSRPTTKCLWALNKEVDRLLKVGFIQETLYPDWLANTILMKKNRKWRLCIDCTDLNKACLKDRFFTAQHRPNSRRNCGLWTYQLHRCLLGYNQIKMHPKNKNKTAFTTGHTIYCYQVMTFNLKNTEATFQWMVNDVFEELIGNTTEVYVTTCF